MNLTLHLAACDIRYLRHYLGLWLGLVILAGRTGRVRSPSFSL